MSPQTALSDHISSPTGASSAKLTESSFQRYYVLFFFSGFPALIYQIVWQRALFTIYGVNIESVTVIVAMFMLGLGLGSLAGGRLSKLERIPLLAVFGVIELAIAAFGMVSLQAFHFAASFTAGTSAFGTGVVTFVLLLLPTVLMGSTLPLLVAHLVRRNGNVGESVGALYCVNTFGSATACFVAAFLLMRVFGESGSVRIAATINACVATMALVLNFVTKKEHLAPHSGKESSRNVISFIAGMFFCGVVGFIALGYEMQWYRLYSFVSGRSARHFALLLGFYLAGVAYGSIRVHDACRRKLSKDLSGVLRASSSVVVWGNSAAFLVGPAVSILVTYMDLTFTFPLVFFSAALLGAAFPLISHASIDPGAEDAGVKLSYLYLSNIIGSTAGCYIVGFWAMDRLSTRGVSAVLLAMGLLVGLGLFLASKSPLPSRRSLAALSVAMLLVCASWPIYSRLYERLLYKTSYGQSKPFEHVVENRNGVITVTPDQIVFGGGVYDGRISTDLVNDTNFIIRAFALDAMHPNPKEVLVVGLSTGAWTQVIANNPRVERITVVEINPGYLQIIPRHPEVASLLRNPKVEIIIDDGRRWLISHPDRKFDFIVMNTSQHWLAHNSNLLSVDFLKLIRLHLKPGGVHYYNTTSSGEALLTGATVFPYALRVVNFLAVSDSPITFDKERWRAALSTYRIDEKPVFELSDLAHRAALDRTLALADTMHSSNVTEAMNLELEPGESLRARFKGMRLITDDNMGAEWR